MSWDAGAGLAGKRIVVTGAAGTIGSAVARAFAAADARVCVVDVAREQLEGVRVALHGASTHLAVPCDLLDATQLQAMFDAVRKGFGGLDVLVHVAGVLARTQVEDVTEEIWDWHLDNNLKATFFVDRAAAQLMRTGGAGGRIVNFASDAWWTGGLHAATPYAASKGGVVSLSRGLARAFASDGITVNCVAPGTVDSPMLRSGLTESQIEDAVHAIPLGRFAQPDDVAAAAVFLASDHASFITATTLNVSGGELIY
ncbi:MAG: short-chain dehydrogenase/reductase [Acidimicrobiaceae bacterium]|nr:short-chain dehydrogenase/reductase [Acidimicrobiaceae bacterium]